MTMLPHAVHVMRGQGMTSSMSPTFYLMGEGTYPV